MEIEDLILENYMCEVLNIRFEFNFGINVLNSE